MDLKLSKQIAISIAIISVALGLLHLYSIRDAPQFLVPVLDEASYDSQAMGIIEGLWPRDRVFYQDPLYPYFLALVYKIAGHNYIAVRIIQVFFGAISLLLIYGIGRRVFSAGNGVLASLIILFYSPFYFYEGKLTKEILGLLLVCLSMLTLLWAYESGSRRKWLLPGFLLGLACLTRANLLVMIPAWGLWIFFSERKKSNFINGSVSALFFAAAAFVAICPVTIHNIRAGDFVLITSQGGQNFFIGNQEGNYTGTYMAPSFVRANPMFEEFDFKNYAESKNARPMKPSEVSDYWFTAAWRYIKSAPDEFIRKLYRKTLLVINNHEISDNLNFYYFRMRYSKVLHIPGLGWGGLSTLAIYGAIVLLYRLLRNRKRFNPKSVPLLLYAPLYSATLIAFYVFSRYRLSLIPSLAPLAAYAIKTLFLFFTKKQYRNLAVGIGIVAPLFMMTQSTLIEQRFDVAYYQTGNCLVNLGRFKEAENEYREAIILNPNKSSYYINLAGALFEQKKYQAAFDEYENALSLDPRNGKARAGIGSIYFEMKNYDEAIKEIQLAMLFGETTPSAWILLGKAYMEIQAYISAQRCFLAALDLDPKNTEAMKQLEKMREHEKNRPLIDPQTDHGDINQFPPLDPYQGDSPALFEPAGSAETPQKPEIWGGD